MLQLTPSHMIVRRQLSCGGGWLRSRAAAACWTSTGSGQSCGQSRGLPRRPGTAGRLWCYWRRSADGSTERGGAALSV